MLLQIFLDRFPGIGFDRKAGSIFQSDPQVLFALIVQGDMCQSGFAGIVEENEMSLLPECLVEDELLNANELDTVNIQTGFFFDLSFQSRKNGLSHLDVTARDHVLVPPLVRTNEEQLPFGIEYQRSNRWFRIAFLCCHVFSFYFYS